MPSKNSYFYYSRFLKCLDRHLENEVARRKKDKFISEPEELYSHIAYDKVVAVNAQTVYAGFKYILDKLIEKAPSASMGADDWLDKFFLAADKFLCTGTWCGHERCQDYDCGYPYHCKEGNLPSKCQKWKIWRLSWRSYPEKEACQKCRYYKNPVSPSIYTTELQAKKANEYKCYCRAKELPEGCPKKKDGKKGDNNAAE